MPREYPIPNWIVPLFRLIFVLSLCCFILDISIFLHPVSRTACDHEFEFSDDSNIIPCEKAQKHNDALIDGFIKRMEKGVTQWKLSNWNESIKEDNMYVKGLIDYQFALTHNREHPILLAQWYAKNNNFTKCMQMVEKNMKKEKYKLEVEYCAEAQYFYKEHGKMSPPVSAMAYIKTIEEIPLFHSFLTGNYRGIVAEYLGMGEGYKGIQYRVEQARRTKKSKLMDDLLNSEIEQSTYRTKALSRILEALNRMSECDPNYGDTWDEYFRRALYSPQLDLKCQWNTLTKSQLVYRGLDEINTAGCFNMGGSWKFLKLYLYLSFFSFAYITASNANRYWVYLQWWTAAVFLGAFFDQFVNLLYC
ncbi:hypothetical protein PFISCL1PPCAC_15286 [Pristionchus fissidentatus]|uniref:Uncharacterized protein n=1 Tax=Pristionchus fissidentatus TaxID=1538716 RepID=A0AAV5VWN1_9BILA|nr:hypothetical protein PFISCL1PPCAC_15286 [Pristionchus fissidentatus]